jgi:elongation factor P
MTLSSSEIKKNTTILLDGEVYQVVQFAHRSAPKAPPTLTLKLRQIRTGNVLEKKFNANQKLTAAPTDKRTVQYLYRDGDSYTFMDNSTFEQLQMPAEMLGDDAAYLIEGESIEVITYQGQPIAIEMPPSVTLTIERTEPGFKGDTASGATKPAVTNTGLKVQVPLFVGEGDQVRIDTRTGAYLGRTE